MNLLMQLSSDLADVSSVALRSMVQVRNGEQGVGAGAIWHPAGLIVTNAHVVEERSPARGPWRRAGRAGLAVLLPDGRTVAAQVLATDTQHDLAALSVDATNLPAVQLGDARRLHPGDLVVALGFPWGVTGGATSGVVIGVGAGLAEAGGDREWIAASLHLRPGHSGGPMVDVQGRLVGINTMMSGPDVGVAIPVHVAVAFLKRAIGA
jgi:serine protease Do